MLGTWDITMHHSAMAEPVAGRQVYTRTLGGAFVLLHWTYEHPDFPDAMALLSEEKVWYFDVHGVDRIFDLTFDDEGWSMVRIVPEFAQRTTARFSDDNAMEAVGEFSEDLGATWKYDYTMRYARVEG